MLKYLLNIQDYTFLGLDIIHPDKFMDLMLRFVLNMTMVIIIVRVLYYPLARRKDYLFSFFIISVIIFLLCFLLENVKLQLGFAFGLFAIFGILRYRTLAIPIKEMTYLFLLIGVSVINALANKKISWAELVFTNLIIIFIIWGLEKFWLIRHESSKQVVYEKIEMIKPQRRADLLKDLEERTGLKINRIEIGKIDFLRDTARLIIYYYADRNEINQADENENAYAAGDDDD